MVRAAPVAGLALCSLLLAQDVSRSAEIAPGKATHHQVDLAAGDYVEAGISCEGKTDASVIRPDGTLLRRFRSIGKRQIGFVGESAGSYKIELTNPSDAPAQCEIRVEPAVPLAQRLAPVPRADPYSSPRIEALRQAGLTKTDDFWSQVRREGTPLVESLAGNPKYQLVTFLWRGTSTTQNVLVLGPFPGSKSHHDDLMQRLGNTDVWYLTKRIPAGARFEYRLSPNDSLATGNRGSAFRRATAQADPLNPNDWGCPPKSTKQECMSAAELPGAVPQPWLAQRPGTPQGRIETHEVRSKIQNLARPVSVYLPAGYRAGGPPNTLLFLFDAPGYLPAMPTTMDNLIAASKIPATVGVLVSNVADRRLKDLVANPEFADFMAKELVPWVRSQYNVTTDPRRTVVGGFSAGGLAAAYMGLRDPLVFGNVLSQSGAFWWAPDHFEDADSTTETNWMVKQFLASPRLPVNFYLDAGTFEMDRAGEGGDILECTRHLRDVLLAKGYVVHYQQVVSGHDGLSWRGTLADGLTALLGR